MNCPACQGFGHTVEARRDGTRCFVLCTVCVGAKFINEDDLVLIEAAFAAAAQVFRQSQESI